jgi:hypothetical protein
MEKLPQKITKHAPLLLKKSIDPSKIPSAVHLC